MYSETISIKISYRSTSWNIKIIRRFLTLSSMILVKNDLSGLARSWSVSVHAVIARTDLEERERWDESRSRDKIRRALRELGWTVREISRRNVQSSYRIAYMRLEILSRWHTAYAPDTGPRARVRETTVVREEWELFIGRLILEYRANCTRRNWLRRSGVLCTENRKVESYVLQKLKLRI